MTTPLSATNLAGPKSRGLPVIIRATVCHLIGDPFGVASESEALQVIADAGLAIDEQGRISAIGTFADVAAAGRDIPVIDRTGCMVLPGFIDCHMHYPQALLLGAYGEELLDWLDKYVFPEEAKFQDAAYAGEAAELFFNQAIANGTTTALIFGAHFEQATAVAFAEAQRRRFRALMGMVLADRYVPPVLTMSAADAYAASKRLIAQFHGRDKLSYAVTPRYAPTCSPEMFEVCARLIREHPDVYFQTHVNENPREVQWIKQLFPKADSYVGVYEQNGLLGPRSLFAHSIYSTDEEIALLAKTHSKVVHCPTSNSFLGSGFFPLSRHLSQGVAVGLGTDVGAGTGYGLLQEMGQAYKLQMLQNVAMQRPDPAMRLSGDKLLYLATLGGAKALQLHEEVGNFQVGKKADIVVIDPRLDDYFHARLKNTSGYNEKLFLLATIGGRQLIREVYMDGVIADIRSDG